MPFVDTGFDIGLYVVATVVMVATVTALVVGFWKIHDLPINKAHKEQHHHVALIRTHLDRFLSPLGVGGGRDRRFC
ncbi:protein of unknown function, Putative permease of the major facilitator superfamily [Shewanella benthica]|uniref:Uncharacterized protein n=1 Tax=Shewanella benthica TaxID=43661 RepID=A0A330M071_9GAMM|nr:protein of unknown function, Putative permease of the major facilitator superfamily [Shewanella benthica]